MFRNNINKVVLSISFALIGFICLSLYNDQELHFVRTLSHHLSDVKPSLSSHSRLTTWPTTPTLATVDNPVQVLLLTYMRSGSSLAGDVIQQSPGAFFMYEPFRMIGKRNETDYVIYYVNGTKRQPPWDLPLEIQDGTKHMLNCDFTKSMTGALVDYFMSKGIKTNAFYECLRPNNTRRILNETFDKCLPGLIASCKSAPVRAIKTIRMEMIVAQRLLETMPHLKLIHLVRDPRATLVSQSRQGKCGHTRGGYIGCANQLCYRLENDIIYGKQVNKQFPGRMFTLFYEDLAREPIEVAKHIYQFIGAKFDKKAEEYIFNITMAGARADSSIGSVRSNSSEHIDIWKRKMSPIFLHTVQQRCNFVMKHYNYEIVDSKIHIPHVW